jgi:hypothetical protein
MRPKIARITAAALVAAVIALALVFAIVQTWS